MRYLLYYLLVILAVLFISPKIKYTVKHSQAITTTIDSVDTSAFQEGQIVMLDEVGYLRVTFPRDSSSRILGIVTRRDTMGEITLKYIRDE